MLKQGTSWRREVITISPEAKTLDAAKILLDKRINGLHGGCRRGTSGIICQTIW